MLELLEDAQAGGQDVTFDSYPYVYGSTRILIVFPDWTHDGGPERLKQVLRSEEGRERLRREIGPRAPTWQDMWLTYFKRPENHKYEGRSVAEIAEMMGKTEVDALCDLLLAEDLRTCYVAAGTNGNTLPAFVTHPMSMVGSDRRPARRLSEPTYLRLFPRDSGGVRARGEADVAAGGHTQDDVVPGAAAGAVRPRPPGAMV